jgi:DNA-binding transcriptional LysR family regulator
MRLQDLDLNLLVALDALLAERNVSRAARRLGLGQPATSAALARLRQLFGDPLLVRAGGGMVPSELATRLGPALAEALARLSATLDAASPFEPARATRSFQLASTDYTSPLLLPALAAAVRAEAPGVALRVRGYAKGELGALIATRAVDLAFGVMRPPPPELVATPLFEEEMTGLAGRATAASLPEPLTAEAFAALPFALVTVNGDTSGVGDEALAALGLRRRVVLTLPHVAALPAILAASDLVAVVPARFARRLAADGLRSFALPIPVPRFEVQMFWSPAARSDSGLAWLRRLAAGVAREL